jgi:hypothetical protein
MFVRPGIGLRDLPWIHRDQYVHYVELAHALSTPHDWPLLRRDLLNALSAAFGLGRGDGNAHRFTARQHRALEVLDEIRCQHDPATDWPAFFNALWKRRHAIRPDLS